MEASDYGPINLIFIKMADPFASVAENKLNSNLVSESPGKKKKRKYKNQNPNPFFSNNLSAIRQILKLKLKYTSSNSRNLKTISNHLLGCLESGEQEN